MNENRGILGVEMIGNTGFGGDAQPQRAPQVLAEKMRAQDLANDLDQLAGELRKRLQSVLRDDPPTPEGANKMLSTAAPMLVEMSAAFATIRETNTSTATILKDILNRLEI